MRNSKSEQEQLIEFARTSEAREVYERTIKNLDPNAFTLEGKIKSYEVDKTSVKKNPMGGVNVVLIINDKSSYSIALNLDQTSEGKLENGVFITSRELELLLSEN